MAIQKAQIVKTALDILDRDGLEGVTLRRLATELSIKAASIYWHISSKEELLDEMANMILEEHFGTFDFANDRREWAEWLDTLAHELRAAMLARREGARVVTGAHPDIAIMLLKLWDYTIRVLHNNGFNYRDAGAVMVTLFSFTFGSVIEEQASPPIAPVPKNPRLDVMTVFDQFATMAAVMDAWDETDNSDARFDMGVRIIVGGVRAEMTPSDTH